MTPPVLHTRRLTLRPFVAGDAPRIQQLAGAREVALNTLLIPHPYPDGAAEAWIASHEEGARAGSLSFAIDDGELVGAISLTVQKEHNRAEVGYWIGVPYWNRGYATEALTEILRYGFEDLQLERIYALVFSRNPASRRALKKCGLKAEGILRKHVVKWGEPVDVEWYGILKEEWLGERGSRSAGRPTSTSAD